MHAQILSFSEIRPDHAPWVGNKGLNLALLSQCSDLRVPPGVVVTTRVFRELCAQLPGLGAMMDTASRDTHAEHKTGTLDAWLALGEAVRQQLLSVPLPTGFLAELTRALDAHGLLETPCAIRSSGTAEDLPTASFAGQHDSILQVQGIDAIVQAMRHCWGSLYSERALRYAHAHGIALRSRQLAVVVQAMIQPQASGVLFTADPLSGLRSLTRIEAVFGLGEALVSGQVTPDAYTVQGGQILSRQVAIKSHVLLTSPLGGTARTPLPPDRQSESTLQDDQLKTLEALGRRIERLYGCPQDIEWCLDGTGFHILQARPITALFPVPEGSGPPPRVYLSVGHQQMMTDPLKPLGLSLFQHTALRPMFEAGSRLFVDVTEALRAPPSRAGLLESMRRFDPLMHNALETVLAHSGVLPPENPVEAKLGSASPPKQPSSPPLSPPLAAPDPSLVPTLMAQTQASLDTLAQEIVHHSGPDLIDFILADVQTLKALLLDPTSSRIILEAIQAAHWLNAHLFEWLGEQNVADTLTLSVSNNVTSELGLALLELADALRPHPAVVKILPNTTDTNILDMIGQQEGGPAARTAFEHWLERYGQRGVGEIDLTRPRWCEQPTLLVPLLLSHIRCHGPGEAQRRFSHGLKRAQEKAEEVMQRLQTLPDGAQKVEETRQHLAILRTYMGFREFPKFGMIQRYGIYKRAILQEASRLVGEGVVGDVEACYFLTLPELREVLRTRQVPQGLLERRRAELRHHQSLTPPRVLTSEGEALSGVYPATADSNDLLVGLPVSSGTVEGRARVILSLEDARLSPGDILVTRFTDPSWTAAFVSIAGLITEVGGLMTHGAVIAREYGIPAIVGVPDATVRIRDGQRLRLHGTEGRIVLLS